MSFEEIRFTYIRELENYLKAISFENFNDYESQTIIGFKDEKKAKALNLYGMSLDSREIVANIINDIKEIKAPEGKEPNYLVEINKYLTTRRSFLNKEIGGSTIEKYLIIGKDKNVVKLCRLYQELYRMFVELAARMNSLAPLNIEVRQISPAEKAKLNSKPQEVQFQAKYSVGE